MLKTKKSRLAAGLLRKSAANTCSMPVHSILTFIPLLGRQPTVEVKVMALWSPQKRLVGPSSQAETGAFRLDSGAEGR
jgi:hypothetical protein